MMQLHQVGASPVFRTWHQTGWLRGWQGPAATRPQTQSCPQGATNCVPLGFTENPQKNWRGKTEADLILKPPWGGERGKIRLRNKGRGRTGGCVAEKRNLRLPPSYNLGVPQSSLYHCCTHGTGSSAHEASWVSARVHTYTHTCLPSAQRQPQAAWMFLKDSRSPLFTAIQCFLSWWGQEHGLFISTFQQLSTMPGTQ